MGDTISVSLMIMAVTVLVSLAAWQKPDWMEIMTMNPYLIDRKKQYWRFISSGFIHADFTHLFFNLFSFYFFGTQLEYIFSVIFPGMGPEMFVLFYLLGIVVADLPTYFNGLVDAWAQFRRGFEVRRRHAVIVAEGVPGLTGRQARIHGLPDNWRFA